MSADVVITSTASPRYVITRELMQGVIKARRHRPLFLIDIAVPRDVDPRVENMDNVFLFDVDDLEQVAYAIEDKRGEWFVVDEIAGDTQRDWIVAHIAVEFLRRCGLVRDEGTGHRLRAAVGFTADQAVAEFAVLQIRAGERPTPR